MLLPDWVWVIFVFAFGSCIGSFLNVVIYRLPRELSIVSPPSRCGTCGKRIRFYDNVPLFSWVILRGRCRSCGARISVRYFVVELLTGAVFAGLYYVYFILGNRAGMPGFLAGGCFVYMVEAVLLASLIAASAIDMELWVIPLSICWFATVIGLIGSSVGAYIVGVSAMEQSQLLPIASAKTGALAAGAGVGLVISLILLKCGVFKRSYEGHEGESNVGAEAQEVNYRHRAEIMKEIVFLLPIVLCAAGAWAAVEKSEDVFVWWAGVSQRPAAAGFLGSLWGYLVGCGIVWFTRIFGTLGFGKEAMGLGDVHLMGAAGAVVGGWAVVVAFFLAPFFGLVWVAAYRFFGKMRQIPYGPFLSLGVFAVIMLHDKIFSHLLGLLGY